ncbi:MAG: hypothetical protein NZ846_04995 [Thermus sp.]|uniref:hypothetical protein n=1 Tax=Thermus sp. TaxID=275 RepID=UPI0025FFB0AC|nr:hypothetical protein [Thermus sp.]MCS7218316.1 hypothetical protein [Thermus sp.]
MRKLALILLWGLGLAQVPIGVNLPEGTSLSLSAEEVVFDLTQAPFPPPSFPFAYPPSRPQAPLSLRVFTNLEGGFAVEVQAGPLLSDRGGEIPAGQLEYRLNGGPWIPLGPRVVLLTGSGPTGGYRTHTLEFRLVLTGREAPGMYRGSLLFTLSRL